MSYVHTLVLASLAALAAQSNAQTPLTQCPQPLIVRTEHYAAIRFRESPLEPLAGVHAIAPESVAKRNHWRFDYDRAGHLRRAQFMLGTRVREVNDQGNFFVDTPQIEICSVNGIEVRHFKDSEGRPAYSRRNVAEERYTQDALGRKISLTFHDADGKPVDNGWGIARYRWQHQHDGSVIETRDNLAGESVAMRPDLPFHRLHLQFGPDGNLALMSQIDEKGARVVNALGAAQDRLEYDAQGQMLAWNVYDADERRVSGNEPMVARGIRSFDADGLQSGERYEDPEGRSMLASWGSLVEVIERDLFGNIITQANRDGAGKALDNAVSGCAALRFSWSADGLHREQLGCFDAAGKPALMKEGGFHRVVERRVQEGRIAEMRFEDTKGQLINRPDGIARVAYRYDEMGRLKERAFFDATGNAVEVRGKKVIPQEFREDGYPQL
jgi:YD repeat-containing protein